MKSINQSCFAVQCFLSYRAVLLCNVVDKLIIHKKVLYDIFIKKL